MLLASHILVFGVSIILCVINSHAIKDLGYTKFDCDTTPGKPKNVHEVRPADINVIGAIGDSLTAGYAADAVMFFGIFTVYRGLSFVIGGDKTLEEHITLPNILKKFNPKLFGQSYGTGKLNSVPDAQLNLAVCGSRAVNLTKQAENLVTKMNNLSSKINMEEDWKLISIFVGGNDACFYCALGPVDGADSNPIAYKIHIEEAIQYIYDNVPKVIINLIGMMNMHVLENLANISVWCKYAHKLECGCNEAKYNISMADLCHDYQLAVEAIQNEGQFERDDFTVVVQPFLKDLEPPLSADGGVDFDFFAPDCFHFSKYGHALVAKLLWNNLVQPVGSKVRNYNLSDANIPLQCPDKACPYIRTTVNSVFC